MESDLSARYCAAMSHENIEVMRRAYAAFADEGTEGFLPFADAQIQIEESAEFPDTGIYAGHDGIRELISLFTDTFDDLGMEPEAFTEGTEDRVLIAIKMTGTAKTSGIPVEIRPFHVHTLRGGKSVHMRVFLDEAGALEAAGLSEPQE
jgi:ketosteroid isomerase-like protein